MRSSETLTLLIADPEYNRDHEQTTRRTIEQAYEILRNDVVGIRDNTDKTASLAMRRHQFLLMGG
jgi:ATP sulfurylase